MARKRKTPPPAPAETPGPVPDPEQMQPSMEPEDDEEYIVEPYKMTISEYLKLPKAEQDKIWEKIGPDLIDPEGIDTAWPELRNKLFRLTCLKTSQTIENTLKTLASPPKELTAAFDNISKTAATAGKTIQEAAEHLLRPASSIVQDWQPVITHALERAEEIAKITMQLREFLDSPEAQKMIARWNVLKPYYHELREEKPRPDGIPLEEYEHSIMQEAEARARADGKWPVTEILELDLQRFTEGKKESPAELTTELEQETELLPSTISTIIAQRLVIPINKIANEMQSISLEDIEQGILHELIIANKGKPTEVATNLLVTVDPDKVKSLSGKPVSRFDRAVHNVACSVWWQSQRDGTVPVITAQSIYQTWKQGTTEEKPSPQRLASITKSLEKQRVMQLVIDATDEARLKKMTDENGEKLRSWEISDNMLSLRKHKIITNRGKVINGYIIKSEPVLMEYARRTKQLASVPARMMAVTDEHGTLIPLTDGRISMLDYLCQRFAIMKRDEHAAAEAFQKYQERRAKSPELPMKNLSDFRKQSRTILFNTLFKETEQESTSREIQRRNRDYVLDVLAYWRTSGDIRGFELQKEKKAITGVTLIL